MSFMSVEDYLAIPRPPTPWVIQDLVARGGRTNIYGKPKFGAKTFVALGWSLAIADPRVREWNGFEVREHGPVMILQIDTPPSLWAKRLEDVKAEGYSIDNIYTTDEMLCPFYPFNILNEDHFKYLAMWVKTINPVMVLVDTLRDAHDRNENEASDMRNVLTKLIAATKPAAMVILSHARKDSRMNQIGDDLVDDSRGSTAVQGKMDVMVRMQGQTEQKTMTYKGRGEGEGRAKLVQTKPTGLLFLSENEAQSANIIKKLIVEHPTLSKNKLAEEVVKVLPMSLSTAKRRLNEVLEGGKKEELGS